MWDLFEEIICLTIDDKSLKNGLETRETSGWGKTSVEMEHVLKWCEPWGKIHRERGATMISAAQPLPDVIDQILKSVLKQTNLNDATLTENSSETERGN